jgi:hypothetical protein
LSVKSSSAMWDSLLVLMPFEPEILKTVKKMSWIAHHSDPSINGHSNYGHSWIVDSW